MTIEFTDRTSASDADLLAAIERLENAEPAPESAVERVAVAIWESHRGTVPWSELSPRTPTRDEYRRYATAAIDAMRGPDQGAAIGRVLELADELDGLVDDETVDEVARVAHGWTLNRIRAALSVTR